MVLFRSLLPRVHRLGPLLSSRVNRQLGRVVASRCALGWLLAVLATSMPNRGIHKVGPLGLFRFWLEHLWAPVAGLRWPVEAAMVAVAMSL